MITVLGFKKRFIANNMQNINDIYVVSPDAPSLYFIYKCLIELISAGLISVIISSNCQDLSLEASLEIIECVQNEFFFTKFERDIDFQSHIHYKN